MVKSGAAKTNSADGPSQYDNLLGIRSKTVGMTIDSSATLGTISQVFAQGESGGVELGVAPMPGPPGDGGVLVGGGALYIVKKSAPEKQAAVWQYLKFLDRPADPGRLRGRHRVRADPRSRRSTCPRSRTCGRRTRATRSRTTS